MTEREPRNLRQRKKAETRERILRASSELFLNNGFDETSVEEIAYHADLSIGTLYNYFANKSEILITYFSNETLLDIELTDRRLQDFDGTGLEVFSVLINAFFSHVSSYNRNLLRNLMPCWISASDLQLLNRPYILQLQRHIRHLMSSNKLPTTIDSLLLARLTFNIVEAEFNNWVASDCVTIPEILSILERQVDIILHGVFLKSGALEAPASHAYLTSAQSENTDYF